MTKIHSEHKRIFIGGTGRSGTSILLNTLTRSKDTTGYYEPQFLTHKRGYFAMLKGKEGMGVYRDILQRYFWDKIRHAYARVYGASNTQAIHNFTQANIVAAFDNANTPREFIEGIYALTEQKHIIHKNPHIVKNVDQIYEIFPEMKFIHTIREPKDIAVSMYVKNWGPNNVWEFIDDYKDVMETALINYRKINPESYLVVSVEELVDNPKEVFGKIQEFTGLDIDIKKVSKMIGSAEDANIGKGSELPERDQELIELYCYPIYNKFLELQNPPEPEVEEVEEDEEEQPNEELCTTS